MYIKSRVMFCLLLLCVLLPINSGCKNLYMAEAADRNSKLSVRAIIQSDKNEESICRKQRRECCNGCLGYLYRQKQSCVLFGIRCSKILLLDTSSITG